MISGDGDHGDAGLAEADHLRHEIQARPMVLPVSVVEVAGNQDEGRRLVDGKLDEVLQGPAAGLADFVHRRAVVALQAAQRAVEVDVGRVKKLEHRFRLNSALGVAYEAAIGSIPDRVPIFYSRRGGGCLHPGRILG